jgi:hypothetical protein
MWLVHHRYSSVKECDRSAEISIRGIGGSSGRPFALPYTLPTTRRVVIMKKCAFWIFVAAGAIGLSQQSSFAQQPSRAALPLADLAREAKDDLREISPQQIQSVRQQAVAAMNDLRAYLRRSGQQNAATWEAYLEWPRIEEQLQAEVPNPRVLETILDKWERNERGLENQRFIRTRELLRDYVYLASDVRSENYGDEYARRVDELAGLLDRYDENREADDAVAIGRTLGWLERSGQAEQLVTAVRARYNRPNFFGYGSQRFMAIGFEQPIDRVTPVNDVILGTQIHGTARLTGGTTLRFVPDSNVARFNLLLAGTAVSSNVGYNRGVTINSTGVSNLQASKQLWMNEQGLFGALANATGQTSTTINGINAGGRLKQRIATKRVGQSKGEAEAIASQKAAARLRQSFEAEAGPMVADANRRFMERFKTPLTRRDAFPEDLKFSTTPYYVVVKSLSADESQIGAPEAPAKLALPFDLCSQIHESAVINFGEAVLGGLHLTDEELVRLLRDELKTEVPEELEITEDKDPWSITFAREVPARARFENNTVVMAIRGDRFTRGEQVINEPVEILAKYNIEITGQGTARLVRDGEVEVNFIGRERLSAAQVAFRTFLRRKFQALFKEEFVGEGLKPKGRWAKAGTMRLELIDSQNHWLNLGWNLPSGGQRPRLAAQPQKPSGQHAAAIDLVPLAVAERDSMTMQLASFLGIAPPSE